MAAAARRTLARHGIAGHHPQLPLLPVAVRVAVQVLVLQVVVQVLALQVFLQVLLL